MFDFLQVDSEFPKLFFLFLSLFLPSSSFFPPIKSLFSLRALWPWKHFRLEHLVLGCACDQQTPHMRTECKLNARDSLAVEALINARNILAKPYVPMPEEDIKAYLMVRSKP